jgi:hypothetical protein
VRRPLRIHFPFAVITAAFASVAALAVASSLAVGQAAPPAPPTSPAPQPTPSREAKPAAAGPREAAVLSVLARELDGTSSFWFWRSMLVQQSARDGGHVVPEIPISCGNSMGGNLDATRALELVAKLGAAFSAKAPFEVDEKRLPIMDGDTFTPLAAVAAEAITRLNAANDGEDVDLSLLLTGSMDVWQLPKAREVAGREDPTVVAGGAARFESAKSLRFECRADAKGAGAAKRGRTYEPDGALRSTAGHVALLFVPIYPTTDLAGTGTPTFSIRVVQGGVTATATAAMVWLPSSFDALRPFTVEVDFGPGVCTFGEQLLATAPDR